MITETWDTHAVYETEIEPLIDRILEICKREKIPMAAAFTVWASNTDHYNRSCEIRIEGRRIHELEDAIDTIRFE
jgi:hypothetical protein